MAVAGYISHPGGVLVHTKEGVVEKKEYGEAVDLDELAEYQRETIADHLSDTSPRPIDVEAQIEAREQAETSGLDFEHVPGNYSELDEEEALGLVRSFNRSKEKQAQVLAYEVLHANRRTVIDGGTPSGKARAEEILDQARGSGEDVPEPASEVPEPVED